MAIKNYATEVAYQAATKSQIESTVSMVENTKAVHYDGVNVITDAPQLGDAVFLDENNAPVVLKGGDWLIKSNIPAAWTYVGEVLEVVDNNHVRVLYKDISQTKKWLDVCQYAWKTTKDTTTDPDPILLDGEEHSHTIGIRCSLDWANNTSVTCVYTATTLAEVAAAMQSAIEARLTELSATAAEIALWHCYADPDNSRIIVQRDACSDYRFYNCSGLNHITWGDMPATTSAGFSVNDIAGGERIMNVAKGSAYYATNGRTPTENVPLNANAGVINKADFDTSAYCALLRQTYGTYANYIEAEYLVKVPQKMGVFSLPDGKAMCDKYGPMTAPKKDGTIKAKFPAMNWAANVSINADGVRQGDWHLWDVREGCIMMRDNTLAAINKTRQKMGVTQVSISTTRWFSERYNANCAWIFYGAYGTLINSYVTNSFQVGAVALLKFK